MKITAEGQPCRKCYTPVVKRTPRHRPLKPGQCYWFEWYFYCPTCRTLYMDERTKRTVEHAGREMPDLFSLCVEPEYHI